MASISHWGMFRLEMWESGTVRPIREDEYSIWVRVEWMAEGGYWNWLD